MFRSLVNNKVLTDEEYNEMLRREAKQYFEDEDAEDWESFEEYFEWFKNNNSDEEFEYFEEEFGDCNFTE